jgi:VCBS repeat-containing protein
MINYDWQIKALEAENDVLISAKYYVKGTKGEVSVDTEGNWIFEKQYSLSSNQKESEIASLVRQETMKDGINTIEYGIETQINALETTKLVELPWVANTFTME